MLPESKLLLYIFKGIPVRECLFFASLRLDGGHEKYRATDFTDQHGLYSATKYRWPRKDTNGHEKYRATGCTDQHGDFRIPEKSGIKIRVDPCYPWLKNCAAIFFSCVLVCFRGHHFAAKRQFLPVLPAFPAKIFLKVLLYLITGLHHNVGFIIFSHRDLNYNYNYNFISFHLLVFYI